MINQGNVATPTRERLIRVAMTLFSEKGYQSTSVADILQAADARSGSLYYFFNTKQDLLLAVLRAYRDDIDEMLIEPAWKGIEDPIDRVFALLAVYRRLLVESKWLYGCPIGSLALELHEPDPPVRELLAENFDAWKRRLATCFQLVGDRLPQDVGSESLSTLVLSVMEGAVMQARTHRTIEVFDASVNMLRAFVNRLLSEETNRGPVKGGLER